MTDLLDPVTVAKPGQLKFVDKNHAYYLDGKRAKSVTTVAKVPEDGYALELWGKRMVAIGMASATHLVESVAAHFDDRDKLNELVEEAELLARTHAAATRGTAMHRVTERADRGEAMLLTDLLADTVKAWRDALDAKGYDVVPEYIERCVVYPEQRICGKFDRFVRRRSDGRLICLDLKSGDRALKYPHSIAIQLGLYVNAPWMAGAWDGESGETTEFEPLPVDLDRERALIMHMPEPGSVTVAEIDVAAGWDIARRAVFPILGWRDRDDLITVTTTIGLDPDAGDPFDGLEKDLHHAGEPLRPSPSPQAESNNQVSSASPTPPAAAVTAPPAGTIPFLERVEWIAARIAELPPAGVQLLSVRWPKKDAPTPKAMRAVPHRDYVDAEIEAIEAVLMPIEREHETQLSPDPTSTPAAGAGRPLEKRKEAAKIAGAGGAESDDGEPVVSPTAAPSAPVLDEGEQMSDEDIAAMIAAHDALPTKILSDGSSPHLQARAWLTEMARAGTPLAMTKQRSRRRWCIARAVLVLAAYDDDTARACLEVVMGDEVQTTITTGQALAALTIEEAERLADMVRALDANELAVHVDDAGVCRIRAAA